MPEIPNGSGAELEVLNLRVARKEQLTSDVWSFELRPLGSDPLPAFTPGANVSVLTPAGVRRNYSLCNDPVDRGTYQIAVKRDPSGRGGSVSMADNLHEGDMLSTTVPQNHFELTERVTRSVFIAGGIGITPILSMMRSLEGSGRTQFVLYYCTRDSESTPFLKTVQSEFGSRVHVHHDFGDMTQAFDFWPVLEKPKSAHVYCCGPRGLMSSVRDMTGHWPSGTIHFESFGVEARVRAHDTAFRVRILKSGLSCEVGPNQSILEVLRANGCRVSSSCESGVCGACKTHLVEGEADHRDMVLGEHERSSEIMVCVSRAKSAELVLDL